MLVATESQGDGRITGVSEIGPMRAKRPVLLPPRKVFASGPRLTLSIQNSIFTPCRLHPTSNGNSISESHPEYEGHAHHYVIT